MVGVCNRKNAGRASSIRTIAGVRWIRWSVSLAASVRFSFVQPPHLSCSKPAFTPLDWFDLFSVPNQKTGLCSPFLGQHGAHRITFTLQQ